MNTDSTVIIYGTEQCSYCLAARMLFKKKGVTYTDILITGDETRREEMERLSGAKTVPQIFIGRHFVGGFDELASMHASGELDRLLSTSPTDRTAESHSD